MATLGFNEPGPTAYHNVTEQAAFEMNPPLLRRVYYPTTACEIASAIRDAERSHRTVRALGSGYSFSGASVPQVASGASRGVDDAWDPLHRGPVYEREAFFGVGVKSSSFAKSLQGALLGLLDPYQCLDTSLLFHVEAGIILSDLCQLLDHQSPRVALHTLGGAAGQTLAGAFSTGTHGGDFDRPPLADAVRAIYLIGQGGTHFWVEPSANITTPARVREAYPCIWPQHIIYDTETFDALLVSFGSMGIIYAVIIDVVPQYTLVSTSRWYPSYRDFQNDAKGQVSSDPLNSLSNALSGSLTSVSAAAGGAPATYLQVGINPVRGDNGQHYCVVNNRAHVPLETFPVGNAGFSVANNAGDLLSAVTSDPRFARTAIEGIAAALVRAGESAARGLGLTEPTEEIIRFAEHFGETWMVERIVTKILQLTFPDVNGFSVSGGLVYDANVGYKLAAGGGVYNQFFAAVSIEAAFTVPNAMACLDAVLAICDRMVDGHYGTRIIPPGWISLRVTRPTNATLGMQQFSPLSAMVEVTLLSGRLHSDNVLLTTGGSQFGPDGSNVGFATAVRDIENAMLEHGGILHWGQLNDQLSSSKVIQEFGRPAVRAWRQARALFNQGANPATFDSVFLSRLGL